MNTKPANVKTEHGYTVVHHIKEKTARDPKRDIKLRARNVSDVRNDHFAQIEVEVATIYPTQVRDAGGSVALDREAAFALASALVGFDVEEAGRRAGEL
jgi:hypothetical protein